MNARWYRLCTGYAGLIRLNLLFVITSLGVVTAPAALVALHEQSCRLLTEGTAPTWRAFAGSIRGRVLTGAGVLLVLAVPALLAAMTVARSDSAVVIGGAVAVLVVDGPLLGIAPHAMAVRRAGVRSSLQRTLAAAVVRPGTTVAVAGVWTAAALLTILVPRVIALPLYAVAVSLPAVLSCLLVQALAPRGHVEGQRAAAQRAVLSAPVEDDHHDHPVARVVERENGVRT